MIGLMIKLLSAYVPIYLFIFNLFLNINHNEPSYRGKNEHVHGISPDISP